MPMSLEEIFSGAKILPNESKVVLAEKLIASIEADIDPQMTKSHLEEVRRRRDGNSFWKSRVNTWRGGLS